MNRTVDVVVLAAGRGKRIHQAFPGVPKVLVPIAGKPMLLRLFDAIEKSGVARGITLVVGPAVESKVFAAIPPDVRLVLQPEPRGTGHAVLCARPDLGDAENVLVLYGDHPLIREKTIRRLAEKHVASGATLTMATVPLPDFSGWRAGFADWGRVIRNGDGRVQRIVEAKDATGTELRVTEVNPSFLCFRAKWLWDHLPKVGCENAQGEYYLTDLLGLAVSEGVAVETFPLEDAREALGVNTPEQLAQAERMFLEIYK